MGCKRHGVAISHTEYRVDLIVKRKIELVVDDPDVEKVIEIISESGKKEMLAMGSYS